MHSYEKKFSNWSLKIVSDLKTLLFQYLSYIFTPFFFKKQRYAQAIEVLTKKELDVI